MKRTNLGTKRTISTFTQNYPHISKIGGQILRSEKK
jgi:hypothetical protein